MSDTATQQPHPETLPHHVPQDTARAARDHATKAIELGLNIRQERFAHYVHAGHTQRKAYQLAGYESSAVEHDDASASTLLRDHKVSAFLSHLRTYESTSHVLTRQRKRELLNDLAEQGENGMVKLGAIKIDNQMTGDDAPIKVQAELSVSGIWSKLNGRLSLPDSESVDVDAEDVSFE